MRTVKIPLPPQQPDCCSRCPLIGRIPKSVRQRGKRQSFCCLGVMPHEPLTSKGIDVRASDKKKQGKLLHRPCDDRWEVWRTMYGDYFPLNRKSYEFRKDYEDEMIEPLFNFK